MATHTDEDLDQVLEIFSRIANELGTFDDPAYTEPGRRKGVFDFRLDTPHEEEVAKNGTHLAGTNGSHLEPLASR
jgi:hypothetical protein